MQPEINNPDQAVTPPPQQPITPTDNPPVTTPEQPKPQKKKMLKIVLIVLVILIAAVLARIGYTYTEYKTFIVNGPAMAPTLLNEEKIVVSENISSIKRYDIIVFKENGTELVKRVIGLPGDRVVIKGGSVTIYNSTNPNGFNPDSGQNYLAPGTTTSGNINITVPANDYYVLGDNRPDSLDSRYYGPISKTNIIGIRVTNKKYDITI